MHCTARLPASPFPPPPLLAVVSAVSGLQVGVAQVTPTMVMGVSIAILVVLFSVQFKGTSSVAVVFSPVVLLWLAGNASIGECWC
jgi:KUP system potassium uptake protein